MEKIISAAPVNRGEGEMEGGGRGEQGRLGCAGSYLRGSGPCPSTKSPSDWK